MPAQCLIDQAAHPIQILFLTPALKDSACLGILPEFLNDIPNFRDAFTGQCGRRQCLRFPSFCKRIQETQDAIVLRLRQTGPALVVAVRLVVAALFVVALLALTLVLLALVLLALALVDVDGAAATLGTLGSACC